MRNREEVTTIFTTKNQKYTTYLLWIIVLLIALLFISIGVTIVVWNEVGNLQNESRFSHELTVTAKYETPFDNVTSAVKDLEDRLELLELALRGTVVKFIAHK